MKRIKLAYANVKMITINKFNKSYHLAMLNTNHNMEILSKLKMKSLPF